MRDEFARCDSSVQKGMVDHFKGEPTSGIREYLDNWRKINAAESPQTALGGPVGRATLEQSDTPETADDDEDATGGDDDGDSDATGDDANG